MITFLWQNQHVYTSFSNAKELIPFPLPGSQDHTKKLAKMTVMFLTILFGADKHL